MMDRQLGQLVQALVPDLRYAHTTQCQLHRSLWTVLLPLELGVHTANELRHRIAQQVGDALVRISGASFNIDYSDTLVRRLDHPPVTCLVLVERFFRVFSLRDVAYDGDHSFQTAIVGVADSDARLHVQLAARARDVYVLAAPLAALPQRVERVSLLLRA